MIDWYIRELALKSLKVNTVVGNCHKKCSVSHPTGRSLSYFLYHLSTIGQRTQHCRHELPSHAAIVGTPWRAINGIENIDYVMSNVVS
jgi:hypothetical protein